MIRDSDKIIVLKAGEIEQIVTHAELNKAGGLYADLYQTQSGRRKMAAEPQTKTSMA